MSMSLPLLLDRYAVIRKETLALCEPLLIEDYGVQAMADVSPPKWHLAHTTWFFEEFLLKPYLPNWQPFHPQFGFLFNSYYEQIGPFYSRPHRGFLARPAVNEIRRYREHVDRIVADTLDWLAEAHHPEFIRRLELGLNHEQQHQELLLTDIKYNFFVNPLKPIYLPSTINMISRPAEANDWLAHEGGMVQIGHSEESFAFDNESPRHMVYLQPFRIAKRLVTNGEFLDFIEDWGYRRPELWLSEGWHTIQERGWEAPLYWEHTDGAWHEFTLHGSRPIDTAAAVCHVSYYEADAYARWLGYSLPSEEEWETAAGDIPVHGNLREQGLMHPGAAPDGDQIQQIFGDAWEWTHSAYSAYPGFRTSSGALGEYNGKFMCNQYVLRGGSCVTPSSHIRSSYRNFFTAADRWQFTGIRLAERD